MIGVKAGPRRGSTIARAGLGWLGLAILATVWQLLGMELHTAVFPTFITSLVAAWHVVTSSTLTTDIIPSLERTAAGFLISAIIGITAGMVIGHYEAVRDWTSAVVDFMRSLPTPLLVPIAIVVFGINGRMVVVTIISAAVWPILINTANGTSTIEPTMIDTAKTYGLRGRKLFLKIVLPAASPQIFAGLRVALSVSLAVMVVAEMLGGGSGIGYFIANAQQSFNIDGSYGGVIVLGCLGWIFDTLFLMFERRLLAWQRGTVGGLLDV